MNKCIVFIRPEDGGLSVMHPTYLDQARPTTRPGKAERRDGDILFIDETQTLHSLAAGHLQVTEDDLYFADGERVFVETTADMLTRIAEKHLSPNTQRWVIESSDLPYRDQFRDAWEWANGVRVNMPRARIIHMDRIRNVRDAELEQLDVPFMQALEAGDVAEQQRIAGLKQVLRDIPQTFDLSRYRTPATLKSAWPPELPSDIDS